MTKDIHILGTSGDTPSVLRQAWLTMPVSWRRMIRRVVLPAQPATKKPAAPAAKRSVDYGTLSVVVPIYNVESYLDECLTSIVRQTYDRLEIIVVDDGSSDRSLEIARGYAHADARIQIICQPNAGLGAARNTGITAATGKFITFADSDDVVPLAAYATLMRCLNKSGSDFAVGSLNRLRGGQRAVPDWANEVHGKDRIGIQLADFPEVLQDVFAWNKVFRRSFWDAHVESFPEGVRYEDQEATGRAYVRAEAFDVLKEIVYDWRIREDGSSITQQKNNIRDLADRLTVAHRMFDFMAASSSQEVLDSWLAKVLGPDLSQYYAQVPRAGEEYWDLLRNRVGWLAVAATEAVWTAMSVHHRLLVHLLVLGSRRDFEQILVSNAQSGETYPLRLEGERWLAVPGYLPELQTPIGDRLLAVDLRQLKLRDALTRVEYDGRDTLWVEGFAYIPGIGAEHTAPSLTVELVDAGSGTVRPLETEALRDPLIDREAEDAWTEYEAAAFRTHIDLSALRAASGAAPEKAEWFLRLSLSVGGCTLTGRFTSRQLVGAAASFPLLPVIQNERFLCTFSEELGFALAAARYKRFADVVGVKGRVLSLAVAVAPGEAAEQISIECPGLKLAATARAIWQDAEQSKFVVEIPELPHKAGRTKQHVWKIRVGTKDTKWHHLAWRGDGNGLEDVTPVGDGLRVRSSFHGFLELHERRWQVVAEGCELSLNGESLYISGRVSYADRDAARIVLPRLNLSSGRRVLEPRATYWLQSNGQFVSEFAIAQEQWASTAAAPESGIYTLRCITAPNGSTDSAYWVPVSGPLENRLPADIRHRAANIRITRTPKAGALALQFGAPFMEEERGKLRQSNLQRSIPALLTHPIQEGAVLFESFGGRSVSDGGLGLFEEMMKRSDGRAKYWSVRDHSMKVPAGAKPVLMYSKEWYRLLHTAEFVVNNNNFPYYYRKHPGQTYIQTWHGTPLKRIGNDIPSSSLSLPYLRLMEREAGYWDYLLAQNIFAEEVLPNAFGYGGKTLTLGYPRNDALVGPKAPLRAAAVREALGIRQGQKVVLYVPTWRDNVRNSRNQYDLVNHLDTEVARRVLGSDYVILLRGHPNVAAQRSTAGMRDVIDVTAYADINDLFLASDALITDYSSAMFDYCVTGKPMYFLTPDLEKYRDSVRGFYFDFEAVAPGPLLKSSVEIAEALRQGAAEGYGRQYRDFRNRFAGMDDGNSAARVYDNIWGAKAPSLSLASLSLAGREPSALAETKRFSAA